MTFAWHGHLAHLRSRASWVAALVPWGFALLEYRLQVPANRIGFGALSLGQLEILREVITRPRSSPSRFCTWASR